MVDLSALTAKNARPCLSEARLKELLHYAPETGLFYWLVDRGPMAKAGQKAGTLHKAKKSLSPYIRIGVCGRSYLAHRLAFLYMTGAWPTNEPDHINTNTIDNRWANLRDATPSQNQANRKVRRDNKTGIKGVSFIVRDKAYVADIQVEGRKIRLGYFRTAEDAGSAYEAAAKLYFGEFARAA
jgi:hypothetical protein